MIVAALLIRRDRVHDDNNNNNIVVPKPNPNEVFKLSCTIILLLLLELG